MQILLDNGVRVWTDENGVVWYQMPGKEPGILQDADSLCGAGILETGSGDIFRPACGFHNNAYLHRALFEEWGWDRKRIDEYFLELMLGIAGDDLALQTKAHSYYYLVRMFGGIFYYRHPGWNGIPTTKESRTYSRRTSQNARAGCQDKSPDSGRSHLAWDWCGSGSLATDGRESGQDDARERFRRATQERSPGSR